MKRRAITKILIRFSPFQLLGAAQSSLILMLLATLLLSISFVKPGVFSGARTAMADTLTPILIVLGEPFRQVQAFVGGVSGITELRAENAQLKSENARLREWYQTALMLESENQSLQALLNVKIDPAHKFITARVVADSGNAFVKTAMVAAGVNDGVQKGQAVLSGDGVVGRIVEAGQQSARILLLNDYNSRVPVMVEGGRQRAILTGTNTDRPLLKYLPADTDVREGQRIVTYGGGGLFMPGLPVGTVVMDETGVPRVELYSDISRLGYVRIVDYPQDPNLIEGGFNPELPR